MIKQIVSEDKFIELCNQELQNHSCYERGMIIFGVPKGVSGSNLTGYDWSGPNAMPEIFSSVVNNVEKKYECRVTLKQPGKQ